MGNYLPSTKAQQQEMLEAIGLSSLDGLYADIPQSIRLSRPLNIPGGKAELEVLRTMKSLANKNKTFGTIFRGAGAYRHYIPSIVKSVVSKEVFVTAYTPYQAEISQGLLQSIFEYQTMVCELTGMDVSNASVYDGATAAAEAVSMCRSNKRKKALVSATAHPDVIETIKAYCWAAGTDVELIPELGGATDLSALEALVDESVSCVYLQQPNYFGVIEGAENASKIAHEKGAKFIMGINPIAAAILKTPGECNADIAVGEGQPLGLPLSFGGPYLGFMASTNELMRKLPGRIVGEAKDRNGRRAFVLTLQAREQHIRREKAGSNVCSNQALCAMAASVYMSAMGPSGLCGAAGQSMAKAHYLAGGLEKIGHKRKHSGEFFHEFVTVAPYGEEKISQMLQMLEANGILGGLQLNGGVLWCCTEINTKEEMDFLVSLIKQFDEGGVA
ncbi:MAG: aminomethyl-transferring glycine dehydrogenase subunit GcvPA [Clostridiales bacterium]|jgi:glycine dehydrogenase subunit 1|nr:aminomethyl-transferring glycine dehydrogenase subunit GcvPA [Clostridiales bacterium]